MAEVSVLLRCGALAMGNRIPKFRGCGVDVKKTGVSQNARGATLTTRLHLQPKAKRDRSYTSTKSCITSVLCYSCNEVSSSLRVIASSFVTQKQKAPFSLAWYTFRSRKTSQHSKRRNSYGRYQFISQLG